MEIFSINDRKLFLSNLYFIGIVSMSRKIIRSTPNRKVFFSRKMKSSLNYLFSRLTDGILRKNYWQHQMLLKLENSDVRL